MPAPNERILLIDDAPSIHEDFRKILARPAPSEIDRIEAELLGTARPLPPGFQLDSAYQGSEGLAMVRQALREGRPYAMAFVDMRMPPGWDGIETIEHLWNEDPDLQVVICTAFSDRSWEEALQRLDARDRLLVIKKPFDIIEVRQAAQALTTKWSLARQAAEHLRTLDQTVHQLRASEAALLQAQRELEGFAHAVAHDLRSPIAIVASFSGLLATEIRDPLQAKAAHYAERIRANAQLADDLLAGLFALTHIARTDLSLREVDLGSMVRQVIGELRAAHPMRRVCVEIHPDLHVRADARLVQTVVRNLVENAWKFSSHQEVARIEVGVAERKGDQTTCFVRDNGCGFDMLHQDKLFKTFQRLHDAHEYPGTGLGLVTVGRVIARHGGRVWARSCPGEGSTFYFTLQASASKVPCRTRSELETEDSA